MTIATLPPSPPSTMLNLSMRDLKLTQQHCREGGRGGQQEKPVEWVKFHLLLADIVDECYVLMFLFVKPLKI